MRTVYNQKRYSSQGIILLITLGILGLISVLGTSFISLARLERSLATNYVDLTRARLAAESGMEKALVVIGGITGTPSTDELAQMIYNPLQPDAPLHAAVLPSFAIDIDGDGILDSVSGIVGSSHVPNGDTYTLRVEDESGKFNLNDSPGPAPERMYRILKIVCKHLFGDPALATDIANNVFDTRNLLGGRFTTLQQVHDAIESPAAPLVSQLLTPQQWQQLSRNLTLVSWVDPNTLKPNPPFDRADGITSLVSTMDPNDFDYNLPFSTAVIPPTQDFHDNFDDDIYTMDQFQMRYLDLEPRAPVHVNTASTELIAALLEGIQGYYIFDYGYQINASDDVPYQLNNFYRLDYRSPMCDEGSTMRRQWMYDDNIWGQNIITAHRNYRPLSYSNEQFDDSRYTYNGLPEAGLLPHSLSFQNFGFTPPFSPGSAEKLRTLAGGGLGALKKTVPISEDLALDFSMKLYDRIHNSDVDWNLDGDTDDAYELQSPVRTWQEFKGIVYAYFGVDTLEARIPEDILSHPFVNDMQRQSIADAILANFNPNSDLIDYNPNKSLYKLVDKGRLVNNPDTGEQGYSTEFCLEATGTFLIQSLGRIEGDSHVRLASAELSAVIELWTPYRLTSQAQFLGLNSSAVLQDETGLERFFIPNAGAIPTAGAGSNTLGPAGNANGFTCQSYPEPIVPDGSGGIDTARLMEAIYDGYIMPATLQPIAPPVGDLVTFRASFNGSLNADTGRYDRTIYTEDPSTPGFPASIIAEQSANDRLLIPESLQRKEMQMQSSTTPVLRPGNLYVDGGYSEAHRTLIFPSGPTTITGVRDNGQAMPVSEMILPGNFGSDYGQRGTLTMWVKPNWFPERTGKPHVFFDISHNNLWTTPPRGTFNPRIWYDAKIQPYPVDPANTPVPAYAESHDNSHFKLFMHPARNARNETEDVIWVRPPIYASPASSIHPSLPSVTPFQSIVFSTWSLMGEYSGDSEITGLGGNTLNPTTYSNYRNFNYIHSETANHRHKTTRSQYNVEGHRWNFFGLSWNIHEADRMHIRINDSFPDNSLSHINGGRRAGESKMNFNAMPFEDASPIDSSRWRVNLWRNRNPQKTENFALHHTLEDTFFLPGQPWSKTMYFDEYRVLTHENPMRFGAWARGSANFVADSTFDEIHIFANTSGIVEDGFLEQEYLTGRYYNINRSPATYMTPPLQLERMLPHSTATAVALRSVSWTVWWPNDELDPLRSVDFVTDSVATPEWEAHTVKSTWDPITVDVELNGDWQFSNADDDLQANQTPIQNASGSSLRDALQGPVHLRKDDQARLKFYFNEWKGDSKPIHEAPILDDITIMIEYLSPRVISWSWQ